MIRQIRMILLSPLTVWKSVNNAVYVYAKLMFVALDHISSNCLYILMFVALDHISSKGPISLCLSPSTISPLTAHA